MSMQPTTALSEATPVSPVSAPSALRSEQGQSLTLRGVSWVTYENLLADLHDSHAAHLAYDRGVLEIRMPSFKHETVTRTLDILVAVVAEEMQMDLVNAGSTTFKREDLLRGFEPDSCFYTTNTKLIRSKEEIDLTVDPAPDLVIEIDITSPSLNKLPLYAQLGVAEVWRYNGEQVTILRRDGDTYIVQEESMILSGLTSLVISQFLIESQTVERPLWLRHVRDWARQGRA